MTAWNRARVTTVKLAVMGIALAAPLPAQALTGTTGLATIPTAGMPADGAVTVGVHRVDSRHHEHSTSWLRGHVGVVQYASVGFLPFLEVGLRLTHGIDAPRQGLGDRGVSVRLRVLKEGRHAPAVVLGAHDLLGTRAFHAEYAVASKTLGHAPALGEVGLHLGYGGDWLRLRARGRQFEGFFGGVSVAPRPWVQLMAEHDADRVNAGVRLRVGRLSLLGTLRGTDALSGGISYTHPLKPRGPR